MQYYLFYDNKLLLTTDNQIPELSCGYDNAIRFSLDDEIESTAANVCSIPSGLKQIGLRESYDILPFKDYLRAGKASELLYWDKTHQFCGQCGTKLEKTMRLCKVCPSCHKEEWPMLSPAIIVLIHDGDKILLVRSNNFKGSFYGLVAGFVEFGESLEEAVIREIKEETQLEIKDLHYFASQPWPYPQGLMLGFLASYKSGTLKLQESELVAGDWFNINNLPEIPKKLSLARRLIDYYVSKFKLS